MVTIAKEATQQHSRTFGSHRWYVLATLMIVGVFSWVDRQVLSIVLQSIKSEFQLSDTQLGMLGGAAFGLFYVSVGLPVAWLADRYSRRNIVAISLALWSAMTVLCATATGYVSLFLARVGVGIGEAGGSAPSQSMISDYFKMSERSFAMALLYTYVPLGYFLSYSLGGWLNDTVGWRNAFVLLGAPGILFALVVRLTVREPVRGATEPSSLSAAAIAKPSLGTALRYFLGRASLRHIPLAGAAHGIGMFGAAVWLPAFFMRTYHVSSSTVGLRLALIMGAGGLCGTLIGGYISDRLVHQTKDLRWTCRVCGIALMASIPFSIGVYLSNDFNTAMALFIVPAILNHVILGPIVATMQNLAGVSRRAMAGAYYLFLVNLISAGLGPLLIGWLSDHFQVAYGSQSLRYSLLALIPCTCAWGACHLFLATRSMREDYVAARTVPS